MAEDCHRFDLGPTTLSDGTSVPSLELAYQTHGTLNARGDNAILFPTWFAGQHPANEWIIGPGRALDPARHFVIVANIFGNGMSSSPSSMPHPFDGPRFPTVSVLDNVLAQRRLLHERLGVRRLALIVGRSMGAQIAFQWGTSFPGEMDALLPFVGSARTSTYNHVFLENVKRAIRSDPAWRQGDYSEQPMAGLRHMRLAFDSWGLSKDWYRQELHLAEGFPTTRAFLDRPFAIANADANNFLAQVATWQTADIGATAGFADDFHRALGAIRAHTIVMPCRSDMYFTPEESEIEVAHMPNAQLRVIESVWGHRAASPGSDARDIAFLETAISDLLHV